MSSVSSAAPGAAPGAASNADLMVAAGTDAKARPPVQHAPLTQFAVEDDCLQVGGMALTRLAARVGQTPFYVYDRDRLSERVALLRRLLPPQIQLHYAMKANPMPAVLQHMAGLVDGIDVASGGELRAALDTTMAPINISFAGPGKSDADLGCAVAAGVVLNMESEQEMRRIAVQGERLGIRPKVAVRVNPDFELKSAGMSMGGGPKQFGVDAERVPAMLAEAVSLGLEVRGLHIYSGSQNLNAGNLAEAQDSTLALAARLAGDWGHRLLSLNLGGGFGVPYFPGERALDIDAVGVNLHCLCQRAAVVLPDTELVIELGRYLVAEAGLYVCRVIERKVSRGKVFLVTDGGLHHHLAASGNFGQVIRKNYPVLVGNRVAGGERERASVVGPLCTPLDLLADQMELAVCQPGDLIVVLQSGAYGWSASPQAFLGHPAAAQVLV